jgi:hypothetical protein
MDRGAERQLLVSSLAGLGDVGEESRGALRWKTQWQISLCTRKILSRRRCEYRHQKESRRNVRLFFRAFAASDHNLAALAYSLNPQDPSFTLSMIRRPPTSISVTPSDVADISAHFQAAQQAQAAAQQRQQERQQQPQSSAREEEGKEGRTEEEKEEEEKARGFGQIRGKKEGMTRNERIGI